MSRDVRHDYVGKASFDRVYDMEDPRPYFEALGGLDYREPEHGRRVFFALIEALNAGRGRVKITDLCCSYGVIAALLGHGLTLDDLYARYGSEELAGLSSGELAEADAAFYAGRRGRACPSVIGVDLAGNAVLYALRAGLMESGVVADLESGGPTEELRNAVAGTDLVTVTGGVGYVTERTFDGLLASMPEGRPKPWVAAFVARMVHYEPIAEVLSEHGLVTEKLPGRTFPRRRFTSREEQDYVLGKLAKKGIDPTGKEIEGWYHSDFYLSRPRGDASTSVGELLSALP